MATVTFVSSANNTVSSSDTVTINTPASVQEGDLLLAFVSQANDKDWSIPSGWSEAWDNLKTGGTPPTPPEANLFYRYVTSNEPSNHSFVNAGGGDDIGGFILAFRNVSRDNPFDTTITTATNSTGSTDPASITTVTDGAMVVVLANIDDAANLTAAPTNYTLQENVEATGVSDLSIAGAYRSIATAGTEDPGTFSHDSQQWGSLTVALQPELSVTTGIVSETDSAFASTPNRDIAVGLPSETDSLFVLATRIIVGLPFEVDEGIITAKHVGMAFETNVALGMYESTITVGLASTTNSGLQLARRIPLGIAQAYNFSQQLFLGVETGLALETNTALPLLRGLPNIDFSYGTRQEVRERLTDVMFEDGYSQRSADFNCNRHIWRLIWNNITSSEESTLRSFFKEHAGIKPIAWIPVNHSSQLRFIARGYESSPSGFEVYNASVLMEQVFE